jgi:poly(A) polymerase
MARKSHYRFSLALGAVVAGTALAAQSAEPPYEVSYAAGPSDASGRFLGGTELRVLTAHAGRLYAGNGYWEDRPGPEGPQGAAILVLDSPGASWRVEHVFDERMPAGRARDFAVSALNDIGFATDGNGARLPRPVTLLLASTWDLTGATRVFSRPEASGSWTAATLAEDRPAPDFLPQIRSFAAHHDRQTGVDRVFAGNSPRGVFSGIYEPRVAGAIRWDAAPELAIGQISTDGFSGLKDRLRVSSFAECNGNLYTAVGQQIYQRADGAAPTWRLVYTNPRPGHSESGLRGLTAIPNPAGPGEVLLAAVEGDAARILRFDPATGSETPELDLRDFLGAAWRTQIGYVIAAYNDMARVRDATGDVLLIGLEAFIPPRAPTPEGHMIVDTGHGRLEGGGWYLVRHRDGRYGLRQVASPGGRPLVAIRAIAASPFASDGNALYFAGYDANKAPVHNTAWIMRADKSSLSGVP